MTVEIPKALHWKIVVEADVHAPREACGLLVGFATDGTTTVERVFTCPNVAENPEWAFDIDRRWLELAIHAAEINGLEVLGSWHSHPSGSSVPSHADRVATIDDTWLLVVVGREGPRCWTVKDGRAVEESIVVVEDAG